MIVVIADSADAAIKIARLSNFGTGPQAYATVALARAWAQNTYPLPMHNRYRIWKVPVSLDGTFLVPTSESICDERTGRNTLSRYPLIQGTASSRKG